MTNPDSKSPKPRVNDPADHDYPVVEKWFKAGEHLVDSDDLTDDWYIREERTSISTGVEDTIRPRFEVTSNGLNFREKPSANDNKPLGRLQRGNQVVLIEEQGDWFKIENPKGPKLEPVYVNKKYLRPVPQDKTK